MELPTLTPGEYSLVYNFFSLTIASMLAAFVFFIMGQSRVAPKYRISLMVSALVVGIAAYHYFRISSSWAGAYVMADGLYTASGAPFNDAYRYVDWLLTVPLLLVELVLVLQLTREKSGPMLTKLVIAATAMIALGYPGEITTDVTARAIWGALSTVPFIYILYVLWVELGKVLVTQPERVRILTRNIRLLLLATWGFYPIAYLGPMLGFGGGEAVVFLQVGYSLADVLAKAGFGVMIYAIARAKSDADGWDLNAQPAILRA
ncbi:MAG: bacteriorhodopsin [Rhodothermales bacterium]|nr:bacteriorhodopsin [Rhodothermales bacterium]MBO6780324.1 bacteriorhodopsin [Rhodothermales bacterium]